ncbi:LOW QUALITY PROTEIN: dehydrogenase/reductase, partial [Mycobacterium tuberculosis T92]
MFDSKVAIVTGAAQGIGQAYAQALAREGASVVVADINADGAAAVAKQIVADGGTAIHVPVDVSDEDSAKAMVDRAVGAFGGIDYLVNNAAIYGGMKLDLLLTVPLDYYKKFMSVTHDGVLVCTRAVYKHMGQTGAARLSTSPRPRPGCIPLLRPGQGRCQRADAAAGPRAGRNEDKDQCDRTRTDRHRSYPHRHPRRAGQEHGADHPAVADGYTGGSGGHVPVPAVGFGIVDHRADLQCRWRTDHPVM